MQHAPCLVESRRPSVGRLPGRPPSQSRPRRRSTEESAVPGAVLTGAAERRERVRPHARLGQRLANRRRPNTNRPAAPATTSPTSRPFDDESWPPTPASGSRVTPPVAEVAAGAAVAVDPDAAVGVAVPDGSGVAVEPGVAIGVAVATGVGVTTTKLFAWTKTLLSRTLSPVSAIASFMVLVTPGSTVASQV